MSNIHEDKNEIDSQVLIYKALFIVQIIMKEIDEEYYVET